MRQVHQVGRTIQLQRHRDGLRLGLTTTSRSDQREATMTNPMQYDPDTDPDTQRDSAIAHAQRSLTNLVEELALYDEREAYDALWSIIDALRAVVSDPAWDSLALKSPTKTQALEDALQRSDLHPRNGLVKSN